MKDAFTYGFEGNLEALMTLIRSGPCAGYLELRDQYGEGAAKRAQRDLDNVYSML